MECNKDEAIRAKEIAESKMKNNDYEGARKIAMKARKLFPEIENISQLLTVCDVHCSAQKKIHGAEMDLYGILQVESFADEATIRKQYRKLALVLHPDKNKFPGAEAAFKLIGQANMVLSDKGKRSLHDVKCRGPGIPFIPKPQNYQNPHVGDQRKYHNASSSQFAGVNHHQQSHSDSNGRPSFWTCCSSCKSRYEYHREMVNKRIRCPQCSMPFTAYDMSAHRSDAKPGPGHAGTQNVNVKSNGGRSASFHQGNPKFGAQKPGQPFSNFAYQPCSSTGSTCNSTRNEDAKRDGGLRAKTEGNGNRSTEPVAMPNENAKKKAREARTSKDTNRNKNGSDVKNASIGNPSVVPGSNGRRSCKRAQVSDSDDFSPGKRSRLRKLSSDVEDKQKEQVPKDVNEPKPSAHAEGSMPKDKTEDVMPDGDSKSNLDSEEEIAEPVVIHCRDLEFSNFEKDKESFAVDQIWACYDSVDGMPRFYAQIRKVYSTGFRLRITWLEADPENHLEVIWANEGLPVTCGKFVRGDTEETRDDLMFSHQIAYEKGVGRCTYVIYPKKGEVWALFRDWDINWSADPNKHMKYKFEIVEVLSDFDKDNGVLVAYMVKVEGFVSLFQKSSRARLAEHRIPSSELFRFSHHIPSVKLTGTERADVPVGSFELDTASLPDDLDDYYFSNKTKVNPETNSSCPQSPEEKVKLTSAGTPKKFVNPRENNELDRDMLNPRRSPRGLKGGDTNHDRVKATPSSDVDQSSKTQISQISSDSGRKEPELVIHDFNVDKQGWEFKVGQIWALCRRKNRHLERYAQIKKLEYSPLRLHVDLLESCTQYYAIRPDACGLFKASVGRREVFSQDDFLYHVKAELNGKNRFNIYPKEKEIWVLYDKPDCECTASDFDAGECNIVEVVENDGHVVKVLPLSRVPGYKSVFRGPEMQNMKDMVLEIQRDEFSRFSSRVPDFLLTEEQDGRLRGCWELDLAQVPGVLPS